MEKVNAFHEYTEWMNFDRFFLKILVVGVRERRNQGAMGGEGQLTDISPLLFMELVVNTKCWRAKEEGAKLSDAISAG